MYKPSINNLAQSEEMLTSFLGYNRNLKIPENSFFDEENMTSDYYPVLSPRNKRALFNVSGERLHGLFKKSELCYINDGLLYYGGSVVSGLSFPDLSVQRQFVSIGSRLVIFPDKVYINTKNLSDYGSLEAVFLTASGSEVTFSLCKADGTAYENYHIGATAPGEVVNGDLWLDTAVTPNQLKQFSEYSNNWVALSTTYIRIAYSGIGKSFCQYDGVMISGCQRDELNGSFVIFEKSDDYLIVGGILSEVFTQTEAIKIERRVPDLDFLCESGNRLWGCSSKTNEIFCSKLSDPTNWYCYMGIASDSYAVGVGTDGEFTGAVSYKGYVLFFKENCVHKIYGSNPPFTVNVNFIRGVQKGSEKSLVTVNETLYYKSPNGIVMYDGGLPISISESFGNDYYSNAVGGSLRDKYYVCMTNKYGERILFCYDENKNIWHREEKINIKEFINHNCNLYFIAEQNGINKLYLMDAVNKYGDFSGSLAGYSVEDDFSWFVETGLWGLNLPEKKYYSKINIRLTGEKNSVIKIFFQYNSNELWEKKGEFIIEKTGSLNIPFITPRCDHIKMRLEGKGDVKIFSISRKIERGSER